MKGTLAHQANIGSGKTTLVKELLNERIDHDKVPCYYWSLKATDKLNFRAMFFELFGIKAAVDNGLVSKNSIGTDTLLGIFRRLKEEHTSPCVLVIDDAQVGGFYKSASDH